MTRLWLFGGGAVAFAAAPPNAYRNPHPSRHERIEAAFDQREGPIISFGVAMLHNNKDTNLLTGEKFGDPVDTALQFGFGWGINEKVTAGIDLRFAKPRATFDGQDYGEIAARVDLIGKYALLPQWGQLNSRCMVTPYVKGGGLLYASVVKGGDRNESKVAAYGTGLLAGGGMEMLFGTRPMLVLDVSADVAMVVLDGKEVGGVTVTANGVAPQFGAALTMGLRL